MLSCSGPLCFLLLLAFSSHQVSPAAVPDDGSARKLEADLFEAVDLPSDEVYAELDSDVLIGMTYEADGGRDVLIPAGWRRFRHRLRRGFRRISDRIREFVKKHADDVIPIILRAL